MRMKTELEILEKIHGIIAVPAVTNLITGSVWLKRKRLEAGVHQIPEEHIVITNLPLDNRDGLDTEHCFVFVNIYIPDRLGAPDVDKLDTVTQAVLNALQEYNQETEYFQFAVLSQGTFPDQEREDYTYSAIKLQVFCQRDYS